VGEGADSTTSWSTRRTSGNTPSSSWAPARGGAAAATLSELGYNVKGFCYQDSPRRAHSIAAQGGINAAKNYQNDGDSIFRLFYDTVKGGDFRAREANVYRLAQNSVSIIDQAVAQGVPFAREYGGLLDNRSFGGAQVSRTFYARGQTGQQLLLGCYQQLEKEIARGGVTMIPRGDMLELVVVDGRARGIIVRDEVTGRLESHAAHAVLLCTGGYGNVFYLSTNAKNSNATAIWRAHKRGALLRQPVLHADPPDVHPGDGAPPVEAHAHVGVAAQRRPGVGAARAGDKRPPSEIPEAERDYFLERRYPSFGNLAPRDIASRAAKAVCDEGRGVGDTGLGVYLDFADSIKRLGKKTIAERYGTCSRCTSASRTRTRTSPDAHLPRGALHDGRALGGLRPHEHDPRAVRRRARRTSPTTARTGSARARSCRGSPTATSSCRSPWATTSRRSRRRRSTRPTRSSRPPRRRSRRARASCSPRGGKRTVASFHRALGKIMWEQCGMARDRAGLQRALELIPRSARSSTPRCSCPGSGQELNQSLEMAARIADFIELGELMCRDALTARRAAAATSARSTRRATARRCATTSTTRTWPRGSTRARTPSRGSTRSRWCTRT
jgi:succinate dehydrogenase / fumarate reductase flavoprotein subunit